MKNKNIKICIIGPSYPFRGGIAHYTTLLFKELNRTHNVRFFSFKRQYPSWLFPGRTDRDTSKTPLMDRHIEPLLDSMNPITWFEVFFRIRAFKPHLVILPWWVSFWVPQFWTICCLVKGFTKSKILFICHNVVQHESRRIDRFCTRRVLQRGDYFIVHSDEEMRNLKEILPKAEIKKMFHPTYEVFNFKNFSKEEARRRLHLSTEDKILLFFGFVRPYKGLKFLLDAMPIILKEEKVRLLVVGEFWQDKSEYLRQIENLGVRKFVDIIDRYIPNEEVSVYFSAGDIAVFPYISSTGSGAVQVALGLKRPVIATNVGCLADIVKDNQTGLIVAPKDADALARAVLYFYQENKEEEFVRNIEVNNDRFSWSKMAEVVVSFCDNGKIK